MNTKDAANQIRAALKTLKISSRDVSVRTDRNSIEIEIKTDLVKYLTVANIAKRFEKIDYCPRTHEVLGGGNTFVFIRHSGVVREEKYNRVDTEARIAGLSVKGWARFTLEGKTYEVHAQGHRDAAQALALRLDGDTVTRLGGIIWTTKEAMEVVASDLLA